MGNGKEADETQAKENSQAESAPTETPAMVTVTQSEWDQVKQEAAEFKDKYLRQLAETENMRKRMQKERVELIQHAMQNVIVDFLTPIDHMENALGFTQNMSNEVKNWAVGFQMILTQFKEVLTGHGVTPFSSVGASFDPHRHEAVEIVSTTTQPQGTVVSESVKGYKMGERIIRPARVAVAKAPEEKSEENQKNEANQVEKE